MQTHRVILLGFSSAELAKFSKAFDTERSDANNYVVAGESDYDASSLLIVNYDDANAIHEKDQLQAKQPDLGIIAVSRGAIANTPSYHLRGMLLTSKILAILDQAAESLPHSLLDHESSKTDTTNKPETPFADETVLEPAVSNPTAEPTVTCDDNYSEKGFRALVVDDSAAIQKSLSLHLETLPQITQIDFADNGEDALIKVTQHQYDLIFLDVMMPGIDGYETCTEIRKRPEYKKTPIIMVSGKTSPLDEVKGVIAGCTTYITKPVQPEAFKKIGARILVWLENQTK